MRWSKETEISPNGLTVSAAGVIVAESEALMTVPGTDALGSQLRMLDLPTGEERWRYELEPTAVWGFSGAIVVDGTVYHVDPNGTAYALDAETGAERWVSRVGRAVADDRHERCEATIENCYLGSFAHRDGVLYLVNSAAEVHALDAGTGSAVWNVDVGERYALERNSVTVMAAERGVVVNMLAAGGRTREGGFEEPIGFRTALLDQDTGDEVWTRDDVADLQPASDGERLFLRNVPVAPGCCDVLALDLATGQTVWSIGVASGYPLGLTGGEDPALVRVDERHEEQVFVVGIDPATGAELWRLETDQDYPILPVAEDGTLLAQESDGTLTALRVVPASAGATPVASPMASPVP